jgi:hypothetical protein
MRKTAFIAAALVLALGACATQTAVQSPPAAANAAAKTAGCAPNTYYPGPNKDCASPGASYSADQLRQTGVVDNTAQALRLLDPAIR